MHQSMVKCLANAFQDFRVKLVGSDVFPDSRLKALTLLLAMAEDGQDHHQLVLLLVVHHFLFLKVACGRLATLTNLTSNVQVIECPDD